MSSSNGGPATDGQMLVANLSCGQLDTDPVKDHAIVETQFSPQVPHRSLAKSAGQHC